MASENSSEKAKQNTEEETKKEGDNQGTSIQEKKAIDEPEPAIQKILGIVEKLHNKFPTPPAEQRRSREAAKSDSTDGRNQGESETSIPKLKRNLRLLKDDVRKLQELNAEVGQEVSRQIRPLDNLLKQVEAASVNKKLTEGDKNDLEKVNKKIFNLMCEVPLLPNKRKKTKGLDSEDGNGDNHGKPIVCLPGIQASEEDLKRLAVFREVKCKFEELDDQQKIYLLSFAVFPENQEVNRTMLMYWWIGEGILTYKVTPPEKGILPDEDKPENVVKKILKKFADMNLIEPVVIKRKVEPSSYKMTPFVHASVVLISKKIGLFDMYDEKEEPVMRQSELDKVCLVEGSSSKPEAKVKNMTRAHEIETVFNVSERFPDFTFKWFSEDQPTRKNMLRLSKTTYKELKVFYLGRWERTAKRHIEVENPELMKNLKHMTKLKLLSFQGISRIERLDDAVCKLHELIILDLRACYNLEKLPDKIDSLKALTYLDITDCYMIDRMPKRLSWLNNLEVLKGFVVSDATDEETFCTLDELKYLKKLRKLSISINKGGFGIDHVFEAVKNFNNLEKLKVAWGGINDKGADGVKKEKTNKAKEANKGIKDKEKEGKNDKAIAAADDKEQTAGIFQRAVTRIFGGEKDPINPNLPPNLKKLDLQCVHGAFLPNWLEPKNLVTLEKLYIKGGTDLIGFGESPPLEQATECSVKVLRLKFLPKLKVEWRDLSKMYFPKLNFLEKYQCPQVSLCPCDGIGIWRQTEENQV